MSLSNISLLTLTVGAAGALAADRFVTFGGAYPTAGGLALGVTRTTASAAGDLIPVDTMGTALVTAGGAITAGATVMTDATGKAVAHDGDGDKHALGRALEAATADGQTIEVLLIPSSGLLVTAA